MDTARNITAVEALTSKTPKESDYFDFYPSVDSCYNEIDAEQMTNWYSFSRSSTKEMVKIAIFQFFRHKYGRLEKMTKEKRRTIAADIFTRNDKIIKRARI